MCLAIPAKVLEIEGRTAVVDMGGVNTPVDISLVQDVKTGDYLIIHAGFAIQVLDEEEAVETLELLREFLSCGEEQ